jgi:hypothetical protein
MRARGRRKRLNCVYVNTIARLHYARTREEVGSHPSRKVFKVTLHYARTREEVGWWSNFPNFTRWLHYARTREEVDNFVTDYKI